MIKSLWIAKTGLDAQQTQLDVISNNLANTATTGFKRSKAVFQDLMYQNLRQAGAQVNQEASVPTGLQVGTGVRTVGTVKNFAQGNMSKTDLPYDVAINGKGFFQVEMPDGQIRYTRDGSFQVNANGVLVTSDGYPVVGPVLVPPTADTLNISQDGVVSITERGNPEPQEIGRIGLAKFINPAGLESTGQNLYQETAASGEPEVVEASRDGSGVLLQGYIETSNVNVVEELVGMIQTQRSYEINSKAITTSDQMLQRLGQL